MTLLFIALTLINLLGLAATAVLGYGVASGRDWAVPHQLAGAGVTMTCCVVHCTVIIYLLATSKWIQQAIRLRRLDRKLAATMHASRAQAFAAAIAAVGTITLASIFGAARAGYGIPAAYHHVISLLAFTTNLLAALLEYRAIARNRRLIDRILGMVNAKSATPVSPDDEKDVAKR